MYVLTIPQAAATLAVTLIGFEIGLFGTSVVNAVLVLILVSIVAAAVLAEKVVDWVPQGMALPRLGAKIIVVTATGGPSDAAVRVATLVSRPDGGHSDVLITRAEGDLPPDAGAVRALEKRIFRHGSDGYVRLEVAELGEAVRKAMLTHGTSLVIVDDPRFEASPRDVPVLIVDPGQHDFRLIAEASDVESLTAEVSRRLARRARSPFGFRRGGEDASPAVAEPPS